MSKIPNVLVSSPIPNDCVSSWRCLGPLTKLHQEGRVNITVAGNNVSWVDLNATDLLMVHRPFSPQHVALMSMAKQYNVPVWLDYDDDLLNVMDDNPTYHNYGRQEVKESVKKCLQLADHVTVTTQALYELYKPYNPNITIIPNALDERFIKYRTKTVMSNSIWWRGSDSHQRDLYSHGEDIVSAFLQTKDDYSWNFIGYRPWLLLDNMPGAKFHPGRDFRDFYDVICDANPDILIVPLHDHVFNHSKSMIAALEGSMAGAVVVAPNWTEWQIPGVINYSKDKPLDECIIEAAKLSDNEKLALREQTAQWFIKNRQIDQMNKLRMEVILKLARK